MAKKEKKKAMKKQQKKISKALDAIHVEPLASEAQEFDKFEGFASMSFSHNGISVQMSGTDEHLQDLIDLYDHLKDHLLGADTYPTDPWTADYNDYMQ